LSIPPATAAGTGTSVLQALSPLTLAVFIAFLTIGLQLPVLPLHLKEALGMNATVVGVVVGAQFAAALLSRAWAGNV
ncbi:arabinose transporter, partial [Salmonella enterica]